MKVGRPSTLNIGDTKDINAYHRRYYHKKGKSYLIAWRKANLDKARLNAGRWRRDNPEKVKAIRVNNKMKRRQVPGSYTAEEWEAKKKQYNYCCAVCGRSEPFIGQFYEWLTQDHIIPISKGGSNEIWNIRPTCWDCNMEKRDKMPEGQQILNLFRVRSNHAKIVEGH